MKQKISNIDKVYVTCHGQRVGTLMMSPNSESAVFQYAEEWLAHGFSVSPLELPLESIIAGDEK